MKAHGPTVVALRVSRLYENSVYLKRPTIVDSRSAMSRQIPYLKICKRGGGRGFLCTKGRGRRGRARPLAEKTHGML